MKKMIDFGLIEPMIKEQGYSQLSANELKERIFNKTVRGEYFIGRIFVTYIDNKGNMEGVNDLGSHHFGKNIIDMDNDTLTTQWDSGWDNWTGRAYDVDGEIKFFDTSTLVWRTTFKFFENGKKKLKV
ncbi:hypothetical protein [Ancylomarina longa]|uniref:Uncharacterized protein n=1 Tax=Ancylomarina longa TaxID=2487017 RepID=A0A434AX34_9BACT|nr:hypothetical protein [Ancylomarina longa]RUT78979.1 hypothetical protein DLK05_05730 [Ancylomarina longa]